MSAKYHSSLASLLFAAVLLLVETTGSCSQETSNIRSISYGKNHFCAVTTAGELVCWGDNTMGQIGNGKYGRSLPDSRVLDPTLIIPAGVTTVSTGYSHTCAIASRMLYCWGSNTSGEIGIGRIDPDAYTVLTAQPAVVITRDVNAVSVGSGYTCAVVGEDLQCWGANRNGRIGIDARKDGTSKPLTIIKGGVSAVATGDSHTCAVVRGDLWCWGNNSSGQIGNGVMGQNVPGPVKVISGNVSAVAAGAANTCAIVRGELQCWGGNWSGQIDPDADSNVLTPKRIISDGVTEVAIRENTFCAVVHGALLCWGEIGNNGNFGIATSDPSARIERPRELIHEGVTSISMGERGTCALVNGALRCRGNDPYLHDNIEKSQFAPYNDATWDIRVLSHAISDRLIAQSRSPSAIAEYLKGHRILFQDDVVYYLGQIKVGVFPPSRHERGEFTLNLNIQAIPLFQSTPRFDYDALIALAPNVACGIDGGRARTLDSSMLYVWTGERFSNLRDALQPSIPVLPAFETHQNALVASAQDIKRIQDCARRVASAIDSVPYSSITYTLHGGRDVEVAAALSQEWRNEERSWVEQIMVRDKESRIEGYSAQARTVSAMQCSGTVLSNWKHWDSTALELGADTTLFGVNSALLLANARDVPAYSEEDLRRAIRAERGEAGLASQAEARQCVAAVVGERFEIRYQGKPVQQFSIDLPAPQPALRPDCAQALVCKPLADAPHLRIVVLMPSSFGMRRFGEAAPTRNARVDEEHDPSGEGFGMAANTGKEDGFAAPVSTPSVDSYDLGVFVVDSRNGEIYNRFLERKAYVSATLAPKKFTLDTGRYLLAPGTRAFGLRAEYADANSLAAQGETTLKLLVREGSGLRKVLDGLVVNQAGSRWSGACSGVTTKVSRIIDIAPASSHGYANLLVTSTVNITEHKMHGGQCVEKALPPHTETATLRYDGSQYVIPATLRVAQ